MLLPLESGLFLFVIYFTLSGRIEAIPLNDFYQFGVAAGDTALDRSLDGASPEITVPAFNFFGRSFESLFVNNNGNLSPGSSYTLFTPSVFPMLCVPLMSVFWSDVDTRDMDGGVVWYRQTTDDILRQKALANIQRPYPAVSSIDYLFIATWDHVRHFGIRTDKTNTFQAVMAVSGDQTYTIYLYADGLIQWSQGGRALAGYNAGDGIAYYMIPESLSQDIINISLTTNVEQPGVWVFRVDRNELILTFCNRRTTALELPIPDILHVPMNMTVFLNHLAVFTCEASGLYTGWKIQDLKQQGILPQLYHDVTTSSLSVTPNSTVYEIIILARAEYNEVRIQCITWNFNGSITESKTAILNIQGPLSAVAELRAANNPNSITISWTAPFSLDVTDVYPDIWYSVLIYNVTEEESPHLIDCTDCDNITTPNYTFIPAFVFPCHKYVVSVIPFNGAGQGEIGENIKATFGISDGKPKIKCMKLLFISDSSLLFTVDDIMAVNRSFCIITLQYLGFGVCDVMLRERNKSFPDTSIPVGKERHSIILPVNDIYYTLIRTKNEVELKLNFTTYDVQSLSVEVLEGGGEAISITTEFMRSSQAAGCLLLLQGSPLFPDIFRVLHKSNSQENISTTLSVPPSTYAVYGYDVEENALPNSMPAVVLENEVSISTDGECANSSLLLKHVNITFGETVVVNCEFREAYPQASCVLVYREYDSPLLRVIEFPQFSHFPVTIAVDNPGNYTFAVFGKDNVKGMEKEPVLCSKYDDQGITETEVETKTGEIQTEVIALVCGTVTGGALLFGSALVLLVIIRRYYNRSGKLQHQNKSAAHKTKDVVYDEIVLHQTTTSSVIPSERNSAYSTTRVYI